MKFLPQRRKERQAFSSLRPPIPAGDWKRLGGFFETGE
jgi:hypothetical protein